MKLTPENRRELDDLLDDVVAGILPEPQRVRLNALLISNPDAQRVYLNYFGLHTTLVCSALARPTEVDCEAAIHSLESVDTRAIHDDPTQAVLRNLAIGASSTPTATESDRHASNKGRGKRPAPYFLGLAKSVLSRQAVWSILGVAVVFYGTFILFSWNLRPNALPGGTESNHLAVAMFRGAADVHWSAGAKPKANNAPIQQGEPLEIESGLVELQLKSGVTFLVEGPARWTIEAANRATLQAGKLIANVPARAIGFTLNTPTASIIDFGTEFGVVVESSGATETQVFRGSIEVKATAPAVAVSAPKTSKRRISAGQAARVNVEAPTAVQLIEKSQTQFTRNLTPVEAVDGNQPSAYAKSVIVQTQPVLYWSFDDLRFSAPKDLVRSLAPSSFIPTKIGVAGPRPEDGFFGMDAHNRALDVGGTGGLASDQLTKLGVKSDAYSIQLWFNSSTRFDTQQLYYLLGRGSGWEAIVDVRDSLLITGTFAPAGPPGHLCFYDGNLENKGFVTGKTMLKPHQWYQATLVRDGSAIRVYLNGTQEFEADVPWLGGDGHYVTAGHRVDLYREIGLMGQFDEVAVWDRALSEQEILATVQSARQNPSVEKTSSE